MHPRNIFIFILCALLAIAGIIVFIVHKPDSEAYVQREVAYIPETASDNIRAAAPAAGSVIASPLTITGEARGTWFFEASFPVMLTNWDGKIIAQGHAEARPPEGGTWMTEDFVPFTATLEFTDPSFDQDYSRNGVLILHNDNPSGDPARDQSMEIPIRFR